MRRILVLIVAGSAACSRAATPAPTPAGPDADERQRAESNVVWLEERIDKLCACATLACFDPLSDEINAWVPEHFGEARLDAAQSHRLLDVRAKMESCDDEVSARIQASINGPGDGAITEMKTLEARMCACTDAACAEQGYKDLEALSTRYADTKATETQIKEAGAIMERFTACASRASAKQP